MPAHSILLVEDDHDVATILKAELTDHGYQVMHAGDGTSGLKHLHDNQPQLVVLDLGLPDLSGLEVLKRLREFTSIPVVILTAHGTAGERPKMLAAGANDYLLKPFHTEELLTRIAAQLEPAEPAPIKVGALTLDPSHCTVTFAGREFTLSQQEFDVASFLAHQPGRVFSLHEIRAAVGDVTGTQAIDDTVISLRRKLRDANGNSSVRAVKGLGFALRA